MRDMKKTALFIGLLFLALLAPGPALAGDDTWGWPVDTRRIATDFEAPEHRYGAGHRGIDLVTEVGAPVYAVADGTVAFAGEVAGVGVVSVDHVGVRSTYQPLRATVTAGEDVRRGDVLGFVTRSGSHCPDLTCLHLGARVGDDYIDPAGLLGQGDRVRLIDPNGPPPALATQPRSGDGIPVTGPVTSDYGWRIHPIRGDRSFHDGVDYGAPCGTPVRATGAGSVVRSQWAGAYGLRVEVDHGGGQVSSYSHLSASHVRTGQQVAHGETVGLVGTTGLSTGCHLHYSVHVNGQPINPHGRATVKRGGGPG